MTEELICPHCGFDLEPLGTITRGEWIAYRSGHIAWRGDILPLGAHGVILQTLMRAHPNPVSPPVLADRLGISDGSLRSTISKLRFKLRLAGAPNMVGFRFGAGEQAGYFWDEVGVPFAT